MSITSVDLLFLMLSKLAISLTMFVIMRVSTSIESSSEIVSFVKVELGCVFVDELFSLGGAVGIISLINIIPFFLLIIIWSLDSVKSMLNRSNSIASASSRETLLTEIVLFSPVGNNDPEYENFIPVCFSSSSSTSIKGALLTLNVTLVSFNTSCPLELPMRQIVSITERKKNLINVFKPGILVYTPSEEGLS